MSLITVILALLIAADPDDKTVALLTRAAEYRDTLLKAAEAAVESSETEIDRVKKSTVNIRLKKTETLSSGKLVFHTLKAKENRLAQLEKQVESRSKQVEQLKGVSHVVPPLSSPLKPGDIGTMPGIKVIQVVDPANAIVKLFGETCWLEASTKDMIDDRTYTFESAIEVGGTKTYGTAVGASKTIRVLKKFTLPKEFKQTTTQ